MPREPKHKVSRRFGLDVYGTGGAQLARRIDRRPGQRAGARPRRRSEFATQLQEKQKTKAVYGVAEGQFRRSFEEARGRPGNTGENLLSLLERRLDNVVYRLGFARSRPMARQLVSHGHVQVDGERVTVPSSRVDEAMRIGLTEVAAKMATVENEMASGRPVPDWLERDAGAASGRVTRLPERRDVELPIDESLITSFYAR
jgi:small subunit ribosomal protein S4